MPAYTAPNPIATLRLLEELLEYQRRQFDGTAGDDLHVSGADLVDWFGEFRRRVAQELATPMPAELGSVIAGVGVQPDSLAGRMLASQFMLAGQFGAALTVIRTMSGRVFQVTPRDRIDVLCQIFESSTRMLRDAGQDVSAAPAAPVPVAGTVSELVDVVQEAEAFVAGFEDDEAQEQSLNPLLVRMRAILDRFQRTHHGAKG